MLIDTHTHLYLDEFEGEKNQVVERAVEAGVGMMMFPNVDLNTISQMRRLHEAYPANTVMAMGLHPTEVGDDYQAALDAVHDELMTNLLDYKAIGEIGIDLYWDKTYERQQADVFARQLDWAAELSLPVIIHCREGLDLALEVMKSTGRELRGVFHSFGGTVEDVANIRRDFDFYFGINGIVTFKNCKVREVLPEIGLDRLLLETDAPYLAPVPYRGKRNESAYIVNTAQHIAQSLGVDFATVEQATERNARELFQL